MSSHHMQDMQPTQSTAKARAAVLRWDRPKRMIIAGPARNQDWHIYSSAMHREALRSFFAKPAESNPGRGTLCVRLRWAGVPVNFSPAFDPRDLGRGGGAKPSGEGGWQGRTW